MSKLRASDLSENNQIIFHEKNNAIVRRLLLSDTSSLIHRLIYECDLKENDFLFYDYKFKNDEYKRALFLSQKIRNLMINSKAFKDSTIEAVSAHSFRVTHAVEAFKGKTIDYAKSELNHKNQSTTYNSYIKPEIRNLNFKEEKYSLLLNKGNVLEKNEKKSLYNQQKEEKNEEKNTDNILDDFSYDINEVGENIIDDDFIMSEKIFYFEGHFYEDVDFKEYQILSNKNKIQNINSEIELNNKNDKLKIKIFLGEEDTRIIKNNNADFLFNNNKKTNSKNKPLKNYLLIASTLNDFKNSIEIECESKEIISFKKIKRKKDCLNLSSNVEFILTKTKDLNKAGIFNNLEDKAINGHIHIIASDDIEKRKLLTVVGGKIYYYKQYLNNEIKKRI